MGLASALALAWACCHVLERGGSDGRRYSIGIGGRVGRVNAPTVFNADLNASQFGDGRAANIKDAIATFERALTSDGSRFDAFIGGDKSAITALEREGYETFEALGCGEPITDADLGRYNVTKRPDDKFRFRVPSRRLASMTAPYFHDGSMATLDDGLATPPRIS